MRSEVSREDRETERRISLPVRPAAGRLPTFLSHQWTFIVLIVLLGLVVLAPLLQPGYFWGAHDARHDVYFIFEYDKSVQDGNWLPSWGPDWAFGYGYPFWIVYGPLATLIGELFHHFASLGFEESVKAVLGISILLSGLAMYGFVRSWLGRNAGLVAAIAYMSIPYHLVDVYVRAALAESLALALLPLVLWGFRETVVRPRIAAILGAAAAYAALMWTSNLVTTIFTPGLALYVLLLILWRRRGEAGRTPQAGERANPRQRSPLMTLTRSSIAPAAAFVLGLGLSAAFFIPALFEQGYINRTQWFGQYYNPFQHFVYFFQLVNPGWGFGISQPGPDDVSQGALSFQLGAAAALLSVVALAVARRFDRERRREIWFWAAWAGVSIFLTLGCSALIWRYVPLVPFAQFPWRYLMLAILPLSILPGTLVADEACQTDARTSLDPSPAPGAPGHRASSSPGAGDRTTGSSAIDSEYPSFPAVMLAALLLLSSYSFFVVEVRQPTPEQGPVSYTALMRFERTSDEMTGVTAWVDPALRPRWSSMADNWVAGRPVTTRVDYSRVPQSRKLAVNSEKMGGAFEEVYWYADEPGKSITFNRFWYPGWTAYLLDGRHGKIVRRLAVERENGPLARVIVPVPAGEGFILLRFEDTPLRRAAKLLTYGTLVLISVVLLAMLARAVSSTLRRRRAWQ